MKSKSPAQLLHSSTLETPKKKISPADICECVLDDALQTPKIKKRSSTKKSNRKRRPSESDEEKIDKKTEENIQQAAIRNNLSQDAVKKILKKVVGNDHVLAIVKLKEEEMERKNRIDETADEDDDDDDDDDDVDNAPKITRSKAIVLNKRILPITSPSEPSEASILIQQELGSDDEDEEYEPGNEDVHSDDEHNSSVSDMDSQPKTPYTADEDSPTKYTNDGLFKIPRDRNDSTTSLNEQDYIIAKRTRSKVSLTTTSIETIESTFQPPDISPDMYDRDNELDSDWLEFLNVLTKPINQTVEEDDETDPEYIAAADQIPIDKEELREVNISKKELNDLVDELFSNLSEVDFNEINKYDNIPELFRTKQMTNRNDSTHEMNRSDIQSDHETSFQPSQISTPVTSKAKLISNNNNISSTTGGNDSLLSITSNVTSNIVNTIQASHLTPSQPNLIDSITQTSTVVPINVVNPFQGASFVNGVVQLSQYQQILVQIPTIDILKVQAQQHHQSVSIAASAVGQSNLQAHHQSDSIAPSQSDTQCIDDRIISRASQYQHNLFRHLKTDLPVTVQFDEGLQGFTQLQRDILSQQLRMHVQFATQNYLQVYGNPGNNLWKEAPKLKSFLNELDDLTSGSSVKIENLKPALTVIKKWEEDLMQPDKEENKEYANFLLAELKKAQNALQTKAPYIPKFHKRLMDAVVESVAFPYPHLLPKIGFRMASRDRNRFLSEFSPVEDYLIAFFLEKLNDEYRDERRRNKFQSKSKISLERICDRICAKLCPFRQSESKNAVYRYVIRRKAKTEIYNPIQYYFEHNKAPPFNHKIIEIDLDNLRAPMDFPLDKLPNFWAQHVKDRQAIEHSKKRQTAKKSSKPVGKGSPPNRSKTAPNSTKSQAQPNFVVIPGVSVPIQYEIVEVNSATQFVELDLTGYVATEVNSVDSVVESSSADQHSNKLSQIANCLKKNYLQLHLKIIRNHKDLLAVYSSVRNFSIYMILVDYQLEMANIVKRVSKEAADELNRKSKLIDEIVEQDGNNPCTNTTANASTKKNPKTQRSDNTRLMLLPETKEDINEKDLVYAQNFMDKVEEVYLAENKSEKVTEFLDILQTFNQSTDKVEELYYKMEQLFLPDHPELAEFFLTFLMPGHAAQIGKFMEHFMLTNMNNFINKLNIYFNKQPAQIRKIMTCLRDLSNEEDLKLEQIKLKIFPLLKGNPLLTDWFKQCFPNETTNDSPADEFESLSFHKAENAHPTDDEHDVYENVHQSEIVPDPVENPCHIRYLNGRVYYGSRILLPAKLSFLVVTASDQNTINEVARTEVLHAKHRDVASENEADYRCVHSIKQYGDNRMKECQKNQLETPDNSTCEEIDIEKTEELNYSDATDDAEVQLSETSCVQGEEKNLSTSIESLENVHNTCDDLTLKAHGIRLNPTVHQSNVIKSEDLLCLLDPVDDVADKISEESLKSSPKKQTTRAQRKSPNSKKSTKRSPINNRKTSQGANITAEDSNAIRTAKRLKRLIESDELEEPDRLTKKPKLPKQTKVVDVSKNRKNKLSSNDEILAIGSVETESSIKSQTDATPLNNLPIWSRDEDKIVLEQIKMGFSNEENLVLTLHREKLPNRSYSEIYDRFKFLMDVIANL